MIAVVKENKKNKNKERCNYRHHMPMLSFLGANSCLLLFQMAKSFIWINETKKRFNKFTIGYMINPVLYVNKAFREKVETFMLTTFGEITQPFIKPILLKGKTSLSINNVLLDIIR